MPTTVQECPDVDVIKPAKDAPKPSLPLAGREMGTQIVVLDRGFVYVGKVRIEGDAVKITNARNIRRWGTTQGLGELRNGPTSETVLDEVGVVEAPMRAVIHFIACTRDW